MIEKESLKFKELEHVLIEKVEHLVRDVLKDRPAFESDTGKRAEEARLDGIPTPRSRRRRRSCDIAPFPRPRASSCEPRLCCARADQKGKHGSGGAAP